MSDESSEKNTITDRSGGVDIHAETVNIYGDVMGRDKTVSGSAGSGGAASTPPTPPPPPDLQAAPSRSADQFDYDVFISYSSKDKQ